MADVIKRLIDISRAPSEKEAFESWLKLDDGVAFLKDNALENEFVMYAVNECAFVHA